MVPGLEVLYANKGSNMLDADQAIAIYLAKASSTPGDDTLTVLSEQYNITMKAVRDVWNLRTLVWCTMPYWPHADRNKFLRKHRCRHCERRCVTKLTCAYETCARAA